MHEVTRCTDTFKAFPEGKGNDSGTDEVLPDGFHQRLYQKDVYRRMHCGGGPQ